MVRNKNVRTDSGVKPFDSKNVRQPSDMSEPPKVKKDTGNQRSFPVVGVGTSAGAIEETHPSNEELQMTNEELETSKEEFQSSNEKRGSPNKKLKNQNQELHEREEILAKIGREVDIYRKADILAEYLVHLTKSEYGFIAIISEEAEYTIGMSGMGWEACQMPITELVFPPAQLRGKHLYMVPYRTNNYYITNSPTNDPESGGIPTGHPPLKSFLGIPLRIGGKAVGMICVANKPDGYIDDDAKQLMSLLEPLTPLAEQALSEISAAKYRSMVESARDGLILHDTNGQIIYANLAFANRLGLPYRELLEIPLTRLVVPTDADRLLEVFHEVFTTRKPIDGYDVRFVGKNSQILHFKMSTASTGGPKITSLVSVATDITERKKAEEKLSESEKKYRNLYEIIRDGIAAVDMDGHIVECNQAYADMLGYSKDELKDLTYQQLTPEKWHQWEAKIVEEQIVVRGYSDEYEKECIRKDGTVFPISVRAWLIRGEDGKPKGMWGLVRDITERKLAEEALRESEHRYRTLFENIPVGIGLVTLDGQVLASNEAMRQITGYSGEELMQINLKDIYQNSEERTLLLERLQKAGIIRNFEVELKRKDDTPYYVSLTITRGGKDVLLEVLEDITERKRAEMRLQESEQQYRTTLESMGDAIQVVDKDLRIVLVNQALKQWTKRLNLEKDLVGQKLFKVLHFLPDRALDEYRRVLDTGETLITEGSTKIDDQEYFIETRKIPIFAEGKVAQIITVIRDITERKKMEEQEQLKKYSESLEEMVRERTSELKKVQQQLLQSERMAAIGETAGMVGHDIRNPLQTIVGALYLARKELNSMPSEAEEKRKMQEMLGTVEEQVYYINKIVSDLQDYARPLKPQVEEIDPHQLINEALSTSAIPENVKVSIVVEEDIPKLMVEPALIKRVFINLTTNAVQAMPDGGRLTIKAFMKGDYLFISFEDTGEGISEDNKPKLFQPLFTTKSKGQGFGLAVCKRLVEAHNGEITLESEVGKGSTFTVKLPLAREAD